VILRNLLFQAVRRIASDPRVQQKAAAVYDQEVKPRVQGANRFAKENIDFARRELTDIAGETSPLENPGGFLRKARQRLFGVSEANETDETED